VEPFEKRDLARGIQRSDEAGSAQCGSTREDLTTLDEVAIYLNFVTAILSVLMLVWNAVRDSPPQVVINHNEVTNVTNVFVPPPVRYPPLGWTGQGGAP
jgi:hypothetical protein